MVTRPWGWDAAVAAGVLVCALMTWLMGPGIVADTGQPGWVPWALLALFAAAYAAVGRRAIYRPAPGSLLFGYSALVVILAGAMCLLIPSLATIQCVAYPLAWCTLRTRWAIVQSCAIAVAVFVGFLLSPVQQSQPYLLATSAAIAALSLAFALFLGLYISHIAAYGHERARLLAELTAAQDELATMHRQAGETSERARLARELHDTVTQSLTGLVMLSERAGAQLRAGQSAEAAASVSLVESAAREALDEARSLVATMTPVATDSGLAEALRRVGARFERETGVVVETQVVEQQLPREQEVVLLRCAQEGLANVRKHAQARRVVVAVTRDEATGAVALSVRDDGVGLTAESLGDDPGFGVAGMCERVGMLGGTLTLGTRPGGGAELAIVIPSGVHT
ncbi:MAG: sensor histidine kinase [Microbacteriaceae bacterium]|nr:sensor histidine kinase [Microbacteriaceae bacterium]